MRLEGSKMPLFSGSGRPRILMKGKGLQRPEDSLARQRPDWRSRESF